MNLNLTISPNVRVWSSVESKIVDMYKQIQEHVLNMHNYVFHLLEAWMVLPSESVIICSRRKFWCARYLIYQSGYRIL